MMRYKGPSYRDGFYLSSKKRFPPASGTASPDGIDSRREGEVRWASTVTRRKVVGVTRGDVRGFRVRVLFCL